MQRRGDPPDCLVATDTGQAKLSHHGAENSTRGCHPKCHDGPQAPCCCQGIVQGGLVQVNRPSGDFRFLLLLLGCLRSTLQTDSSQLQQTSSSGCEKCIACSCCQSLVVAVALVSVNLDRLTGAARASVLLLGAFTKPCMICYPCSTHALTHTCTHTHAHTMTDTSCKKRHKPTSWPRKARINNPHRPHERHPRVDTYTQ